jgi:hypothetical protein
MSDPDYTAMPDHKLIDELGTDAMKWATAFCQIKRKQGWTSEEIDEGLMVGWFANAIEAAR